MITPPEPHIERLDELPVLFALLQKMGLPTILDEAIPRHGNWLGLSAGWVMTIWLIHILSEKNHFMEPVQAWVESRLHLLERLTEQSIRPLDFSDDRLAWCLEALSQTKTWHPIEALLGERLIRVYRLPGQTVRLDATVGTVHHNPADHPLFQIGKTKAGTFDTQFKVMLGSLDPLGLPLAVDVVAGNTADDPLYQPSYTRIKQILPDPGLLVVGDSKMSALETRRTIVSQSDYYLCPLAMHKSEQTLLDETLAKVLAGTQTPRRIYQPQDRVKAGRTEVLADVIEHTRSLTNGGQQWLERVLCVRSRAYAERITASLNARLDQAETALQALTPPRQRGRRQISDEATLLEKIAQIEKKHQVEGLFAHHYESETDEAGRVRYQLTVTRKPEAIKQAHLKAGWKLYSTNAPVETLSQTEAVLAYRQQYTIENVFRRLQSKHLSLTPLHLQRDAHAQGLVHLLSLGARVLALGDYLARTALAEEGPDAVLRGVYRGSAKRGTATPTTERMLKAFENLNLVIWPVDGADDSSVLAQVTSLSAVQTRILGLLSLSPSLYTALSQPNPALSASVAQKSA